MSHGVLIHMGGRGRGRGKGNNKAGERPLPEQSSPTALQHVAVAAEVSTTLDSAPSSTQTMTADTITAATITNTNSAALSKPVTASTRPLVSSRHSTPANSRGNSPTNGGSEASTYSSSVLATAREKAKQDAERRLLTFLKFEEAKCTAARNELVMEEAKEWQAVVEVVRREVELAHMVAAHKRAEGHLFLNRHVSAAVDHLEVTERESRDELEDEELEALAVVVGQLFLSRESSACLPSAEMETHAREELSMQQTEAEVLPPRASMTSSMEQQGCVATPAVTTAAADLSIGPTTEEKAKARATNGRSDDPKKKSSEEEAEHAFESLRNDNKPVESACPCCSLM